jgi:hypothetical protein
MMTEEQIVARLLAARLDKGGSQPMFTKEQKERMRQELLASFRPAQTASERAERRWHKDRPILAVIADTLAQTEALLAHIKRGVYAPSDCRAEYEPLVRELNHRTQEQLTALSACAKLRSLE